MEHKINVINESENEIEVTLSYDEISSEIENAYKEERKTIEMPGFRKGKVPMQMIKKVYGDAIEYKASEDIAQKKFWDVADELELKPISVPQLTDIDFQKGEKLSFKVKYEVKPSLELKDYTGNEIEKPVFKVKDEDIEKEVQHLLKSQAKFEEADKIENENYKIEVDIQRIDESGTPIVGTRNENMSIDLSDPQVNPKIVESVLGKQAGDQFNFDFTDEHYHGEEKHVENYKFTGEVKKIEKIVLPEPDEELIKKISRSKASNLDELKSEVRKNYEQYYNGQSENIYTNGLLSTITKNNDFQPPRGFVETVLNRMVEQEKENAQRYGNKNFDEKAAKEQLKQRAEWNAKWQIIMENIANKENIKVEDADLEILAEKEAEQTGIPKEKLVKYYKDTNRDAMLLEEKVINFLKENNKVKEVDPDELNSREEKSSTEKKN